MEVWMKNEKNVNFLRCFHGTSFQSRMESRLKIFIMTTKIATAAVATEAR